jgi:hypothetical protein
VCGGKAIAAVLVGGTVGRSRLALLVPVLMVLGVGGVSCTSQAVPHTVSGFVRGADGRYVDVMLGFDVVDAAGNKIDVDGNMRLEGYSAIQRVNWCLAGTGSSSSLPGCAGHPFTNRWSITVPSNAALVYVEVYPRGASPSGYIGPPGYHGYIGPYPGTMDQRRYGMSYRREIPVSGPGASNVPIILPQVCVQTGSLGGFVTGLPKGATGSVHAWSLEANDTYILGMGFGTINANGTYSVPHLAGLSHYGLIASAAGKSLYLINLTMATTDATFIGVACKEKRFDLHF